MVYKKYIKKGDKVFGPYYYKNERKEGKVVTQYVGREDYNENNKLIPFIILVFLVLLISAIAFADELRPTGRISFDIIGGIYEPGENIDGSLDFYFSGGELIPSDSLILLELDGLTKEILFSKVSSSDLHTGNFYAEGSNLEGEGEGFGVLGARKIYPNVNFEVLISKIEDAEPEADIDNADAVADAVDTPDASDAKEPVEDADDGDGDGRGDEVQDSSSGADAGLDAGLDESAGADLGPAVPDAGAGITGAVISESGIILSGAVNNGNPVEYELGEGETAELIENSVSTKDGKIGDDEVSLSIKDGKAIIETDYFIEEEGFGEEYFDKSKKLTISVDLADFDLKAEKGVSSIDVALVYDGKILASAGKEILVKGENNETNKTDGDYNIEAVQHQAVLGEPVKWSKTYKFSNNPADKVVIGFSEEVEDAKVVEVVKRKNPENDKVSEITINVSKENDDVLIGEGSGANLGSDAAVITGEVIVNLQLDKESNVLENFLTFIKGIFSPTGNVISDSVVDAGVDQAIEEVTVEYFTEAPYAIESETESEKIVQIVGPPDIHYSDVFAYTDIPERFNIKNANTVKILWQEEGVYLNPINVLDKDANEIYDYVEWIAPQLSNQTFIIEIVKAEHLDSEKSFISDIYPAVFTLDGVWSETILEGEYTRITFERNLTSDNDITVYPRAVSGSPRIEIYEFNGTTVIAEFSRLNDNQYNKVFLFGLVGEQDTFDLKILDGSVEFDHIIDPIDEAPNISFVSPTPADAETVTVGNFYVNVSSSDGMTDHYGFVDFNSDLALWVRMDDLVSETTNPVDLSSYSNNGTSTGNAVQNSSGAYGSRFDFDGNGDYISFAAGAASSVFDNNVPFTVSAWVKSGDASASRQIVSDTTVGSLGWALFFDSSGGTMKFEVSNGTSSANCAPESTITDNVWHFVYGRYDGSAVSCGVDGADTTGGTYTGNAFINLVGPSIGSLNGASAVRSWNGSIDEVIIFNRSLSNTEIDSVFNATSVQYQKNFTSLLNATYTIKGYAVDRAGKKNATEQRSITINTTNTGTIQNINSCVTITSPNKIYNLTANILVNELQVGSCITINAQNITFEGNGFQIGKSSFANSLIYSNQNSTIIRNVVLNRSTALSSTGEITLVNASQSNITGVTFGPGNIGIVIQDTHDSHFNGNTFVTSDRGLNTVSTSSRNVFSNNAVNGANYGAVITGNNNVVNASNFTSMVINALYITGSNNVFENTHIRDSTQSAIYFASGDSNVLDNLTVNGTNPSYYDIDFVSSNKTEIIDTNLGRYTINAAGSILRFVESGVGEIQFLALVNGSGSNLSNDVSISLNLVNVSTSSNIGLNKSANVTLYGLATNYTEPYVFRDGFVCSSSSCLNYTSLNAGSVIFKVPSFTTYYVGDLPVCTALSGCTEGGVCAISKDCRLSSDLCTGGLCQFANVTFNADIYTGHDASGNAKNLALNLSGSILFSSGNGIIFSGKDNNPLGGSTEDGGDAGTVNITVSPTGLLNRTNAYFDGRGGDANDIPGDGGILQLNYHGLLGATSSWSIDVTKGTTSGGGGAADGAIVYNKYLAPCPRDADVDNSGTIVGADYILITNKYNNLSSDSGFNSYHDINCDDKLNVIEISRIGFNFFRGQ